MKYFTDTLLFLTFFLLVSCVGDDNLLSKSGLGNMVTTLQVTPSITSIPTGLHQQYQAQVILENGKVIDVTTDLALSWMSNDTAIAKIGVNTGLAVGVMSGKVLIIAFGLANGEMFSNSRELIVSAASIISNTIIVAINGNSADGQSFPAGISVQFDVFANFSDGSTQSTVNGIDDASFISWSIAGNTGATITTEGALNTTAVSSATTLIITATGQIPGAYAGETDTIAVIISDAIVNAGSTVIAIEGNSVDDQSFPAGIPVQLEASTNFSDGSVQSTANGNDDASFISWSIAGNTGAIITTEGALNTTAVSSDTTLIITATGHTPGAYAGETDAIAVIISDAIVNAGSAVITIEGNSADGQTFPAGIPVQLETSVNFSDGSIQSTANGTNDASFISWSIAGNTGATITTEGALNTTAVSSGTTLIITATGHIPGPYSGETDTISVVISDAIVNAGSTVIAIAGNSADDQSFPAGISVQLEASANFSDGSTQSTVNGIDDASFISWSILGNTGAIISTEGILNTSGVDPNTTLVITATGIGPLAGESDNISIEINLSEFGTLIMDAHVNGSGVNFGGESSLRIKLSTAGEGSPFTRITYLKFSIKDMVLLGGETLTLVMNAKASGVKASLNVSVSRITTNWEEYQVTANLAPLDTGQTITLAVGEVEWDVTSLALLAQAQGLEALSLKLTVDQVVDGQDDQTNWSFDSRESSGEPGRLVIR